MIPKRWRECGECSACCTVMSVDEIGKATDTRCEHQRDGGGCGIYAKRPPTCAGFYCMWLAEGSREVSRVLVKVRKKQDSYPRQLREVERPDRSGVLIHMVGKDSKFLRETGVAMFVAREVVPGAFEAEAGRALIDRFSKTNLLYLVRGDERRLIGPAGLVVLAEEFVRKVNEERAGARQQGDE